MIQGSPGVYLNEKDDTFLQPGIVEEGPVLIGETEHGPAFIPTKVTTISEFKTIFGSYTDDNFVPYAAASILKNTNVLNVVRVLGISGYTEKGALCIRSGNLVTTSSNDATVYCIVKPTYSASSGVWNAYVTSADAAENSGSVRNFHLFVSSAAMTSYVTYQSLSLVETDTNYIGNIIGTDPRGPLAAYVDKIFTWKVNLDSSSTLATNIAGLTASVTASSTFLDYTREYSNASTPTIYSQKYGSGSSNKQYSLFKLYTIEHGVNANKLLKAEIRDIKPSATSGSYGTFTIAIRDYGDTNQRPEYVETFTNLTFDPDSLNYLPRRIGDKYYTYNSTMKQNVVTGDFDNISKYVYVEMYDLGSVPKDALPFGFRAYTLPISYVPAMPYATGFEISGQYSVRGVPGVDYDLKGIGYYFDPLPDNASSTGSGTNFYLGNCSASANGGALYTGAVTLTNSTPIEYRKFLVGFAGGFDGTDPRNTPYTYNSTGKLDCTGVNTSGTQAFKRALDILSNPDDITFDLMALPGLNYTTHPTVINYAADTLETRGNDAMLIFDPVGKGTTNVETVTSVVSSLDNSYLAAYWPWIKVTNPEKSKYVWKPASTEVLGAIKFNDKVKHPWYAPAGLNRGMLGRVKEVELKLKADHIQTLYDGRVNPIATFSEGIVVWGQKNLQLKETMMNRVNTRRLMITAKKAINTFARWKVFEQNDSTTRTELVNAINPYLQYIQEQRGLYEFKVVCDETNNTPDIIDRNQMYGQIYLKPTTSAEYIIMDFNISKSGVSFTDI